MSMRNKNNIGSHPGLRDEKRRSQPPQERTPGQAVSSESLVFPQMWQFRIYRESERMDTSCSI